MSTFDKIAWGLAVLVTIPALIAMSGFIVAGALALGILGLLYGGRYGLRVYEQQNVGKRSAGSPDVNKILQSGGSNGESRWER